MIRASAKRVEAMPNRISVLINWTMLRAGFGCLLGMAMTSCTVVEELHRDGATTRSFAFAAPVIVHPDPSGQGSVVKVTGLGFLASNDSTTLGFFDKSKITLDHECRFVLMGNTDEQLRNFVELLPQERGLCLEKTLQGRTQ